MTLTRTKLPDNTNKLCSVNIGATAATSRAHMIPATYVWVWDGDATKAVFVCDEHDQFIYKSNTPDNDKTISRTDLDTLLQQPDDFFNVNRVRIARVMVSLVQRYMERILRS